MKKEQELEEERKRKKRPGSRRRSMVRSKTRLFSIELQNLFPITSLAHYGETEPVSVTVSCHLNKDS